MIYLKSENGSTGVYALTSIAKGKLVYRMSPDDTLSVPTQTSVQIEEGVHIEDKVGKFLNHSCNPTCRVEYLSILALRDIEENEQITFNYLENELTITHPFQCHCCGKLISGKND